MKEACVCHLFFKVLIVVSDGNGYLTQTVNKWRRIDFTVVFVAVPSLLGGILNSFIRSALRPWIAVLFGYSLRRGPV